MCSSSITVPPGHQASKEKSWFWLRPSSIAGYWNFQEPSNNLPGSATVRAACSLDSGLAAFRDVLFTCFAEWALHTHITGFSHQSRKFFASVVVVVVLLLRGFSHLRCPVKSWTPMAVEIIEWVGLLPSPPLIWFLSMPRHIVPKYTSYNPWATQRWTKPNPNSWSLNHFLDHWREDTRWLAHRDSTWNMLGASLSLPSFHSQRWSCKGCGCSGPNQKELQSLKPNLAPNLLPQKPILQHDQASLNLLTSSLASLPLKMLLPISPVLRNNRKNPGFYCCLGIEAIPANAQGFALRNHSWVWGVKGNYILGCRRSNYSQLRARQALYAPYCHPNPNQSLKSILPHNYLHKNK